MWIFGYDQKLKEPRKNENEFEYYSDLKNEDNLKNDNNIKNEVDLKNEDGLTKWPSP